MSEWLICLVTIAYLAVAAEYGLSGKAGLAVTFAAYAVANIGLLLAARGH